MPRTECAGGQGDANRWKVHSDDAAVGSLVENGCEIRVLISILVLLLKIIFERS